MTVMNDTISDAFQQQTTPSGNPNSLSRTQFVSDDGYWINYSRERELTTDVIQAVQYTLTPFTAGMNNLVVICDELKIDKAISLPGKNVRIIARRILASEGASIDVSGADATSVSMRADDAHVPGQNGANGENGEHGKPAGSILLAASEFHGSLNLIANGGRGANGQNAGNGAVGISGADGKKSTADKGPGDGEPGKKGGTGGQGGNGGGGGASGEVTVIGLNDADISKISISNLPGIAGSNGNPGQGGQGGPGGNPGDPKAWRPGIREGVDGAGAEPEEVTWPSARYGPTGPQGELGATNDFIPQNGVEGHITRKQLSAADIAPELPITQLQMALTSIWSDFTSGRLQDLLRKLDWVKTIAGEPLSGKNFYDARKKRTGDPFVGMPLPEELQAISDQANVLLNRLQAGLDPFGHSPTYVGSLSPKFLADEIDRQFSIAFEIEKKHDEYLDKVAKLSDPRDALRDTLLSIEDRLRLSESEIAKNEKEANILQQDIAVLNSKIVIYERDIRAADKNFQEAVSRQSAGCEIVPILTFVAGVIAVCYGVSEGLIAMKSALDAVNKDKDGNLLPPDNNLIKDIRVIGKTFEDAKTSEKLDVMKKGFELMQEGIKKDNAKIVVSLESFEEQLKPYLSDSMPEAIAYRDLIRSFVEVTRARNDKQQTYTKAKLQAMQWFVEKNSLQLQRDRVVSLYAQTTNPALTENRVFLTSYLTGLKLNLLEKLDLYRRALTYVTLVPLQPIYKLGSVEALSKTRESLRDAWIKAKDERFGRATQTNESMVVIKRKDNPQFFEQLQKGEYAAFSIGYDNVSFNGRDAAYIYSYQVQMSIPGIKSKNPEFTCSLIHLGSSIVRDGYGKLMNFTHEKRETLLSYRQANDKWEEKIHVENNLGGNEDNFVFLSPFSAWTLSFTPDSKIDLSGVKEVRFKFWSRFIPDKVNALENFHTLMPRL